MELEIQLLESSLVFLLFAGPGQQGPEEGEDQLCVSDRACGQDGAAGQQHQEAHVGTAPALRGGRYLCGGSLRVLFSEKLPAGTAVGLDKPRVVPNLIRLLAVS